ncbi:MAG: hypothetical protein IH899_12240 [Planctomycetes bacterium]|nr:hypothetical protein [Planctomycetota bacterium]
MANHLSKEKQILVLKMLVEGNSIRSTERITGVRKRTITNLLVSFGDGCCKFLNQEMRGLKLKNIECDEIWTFA